MNNREEWDHEELYRKIRAEQEEYCKGRKCEECIYNQFRDCFAGFYIDYRYLELLALKEHDSRLNKEGK